jgi:hypothetical protein
MSESTNGLRSNEQLCGHYKSKSSATRAMKKWVGNQTSVSYPGISNRYETTIFLRADMMEVTRIQNGWGENVAWGVRIVYTPADIYCVILGEDGPKDVPYTEIAHREDSCTPPHETRRGTFPCKFKNLKEAEAAGFSLWFREGEIAVVANSTSAYVVRTPYAA